MYINIWRNVLIHCRFLVCMLVFLGDMCALCRVCADSCLCAEITCGPPLNLPHTNLIWDRTSRPGSVVLYECVDGFYQESGNNISTCLLSGEWGEVSVKCKGTVIMSFHGCIYSTEEESSLFMVFNILLMRICRCFVSSSK